jgi:FG-GAP-like repeat/Bacterial Ig-like domain (group 3)
VTWSNGTRGFAQLAVGDVNGDGRADVAVGPSRVDLISEVQVLLGLADGSLTRARTFTTSAKGNADDIEIADLNRDGNGDLVMPVNGGDVGGFIGGGTTVSVLLSNGDGTFRAPAEFAAGRPAVAEAAVADFNGDGKLDVVVTNHINSFGEADTVSVLLGNGDGTLAAPRSTPLFELSGPFNMVAADLNGDGRQDVAVAHSTGSINFGWASVLFGNGDGQFSKIPRFQVRNLGTQGPLLATADFNRDGLGDLVLTGLDVSLQKTGPYTFSDDAYDPRNPEQSIGAFLGNGLFGLPEIYSTPSTRKVVAADFDRDGWSDIATIGEEGDTRTLVVTVLLNRTAAMPVVSLSSLALDSDTVPENSTSGGTVTLSAPAPPGGTIVELATTNPSLIDLPPRATVTVPAGQTSARFSFRTFGSPSFNTATVIAQLGDVTRTARLTVGSRKRATGTSVSCAPSTVRLGGATTCTATVTDTDIGESTPTGMVSFSSSGSGTFSPATCTLAGSGDSAGCSVTCTLTARGTHTISASYAGDATHLGSSGSTTVRIAGK